ncbi:MAG TPA: malectin domain-containing carbohydrate-binding protein [Planctomycetaceae bacterium]|nr:malectin domain-containing carbohydrate-binding protein [Planctomycetaceae bacterium]
MSAVTWTGKGNDNLWNDGNNWNSGAVPQSTDDVTISTAAGTTIQVATTSVTIHSLNTNAAINVASGITFSSPTISASANFKLAGGTLKGGTFTGMNGAELVMSSTGGTLNGVTINGNLDLSQAVGATAYVTNNLVLNGTLNLGNAAGTTYGQLFFTNTQTLSGTGTVLFGPNTDNYFDLDNASTTLTIGSGITIAGSSGTIVGNYSTDVIVNQGTISADNSGGVAGSFVFDTDFSGGAPESTTVPINTSTVANPAPQAVYQTERYGDPTYTLPNLTPSATYTVQLDFAEFDVGAAGKKLMNVSINGTQVLTNFDVFATAGGDYKALAKSFTATANSNGQIVISFTTANNSTDQSSINGIELYSGSTQVLAINAGDLFTRGALTISPGGTFTNQGTVKSSNAETLIINGVSGNVGAAALGGTGSLLELNGSAYTINQGLTVTTGQTLALFGSWTNASGSTISATGGTLDLGDQSSSSTHAWSNAGALTSSNATANLGGVFTLAAMGTFNETSDTTNLVGTFNNTGTTLALGPATGTWNLEGGTVHGGTVTESGGAVLNVVGAGATLNGLTIDGDLDMEQIGGIYGAAVSVVNGLTLNGTLYIGNTAGTTYGDLYFTNTETLAGTGRVVFGPNVNNLMELKASPATLTIGSGITISGSSGTIEGEASTDTIVNQGTINADDSGGAAPPFVYDTDFSGGVARSTFEPINTSAVTNPAPQAVYQTERYGTSFTYTLPNLTPSATYTVQLDFAEIDVNAAGQKLMNVSINGTQVLTSFDLFATAGAIDKALAETFTAAANSNGQIVIAFSTVSGSKSDASVNGIELYSGSTQVLAINAGEPLTSGALTISPVGAFKNQGTITSSSDETLNINDFTNSATINGNGVALELYGAWTNATGASITQTGGTLNLGDQFASTNVWSNAGTITASNATVNLGGLFTVADMGTFNQTNDTNNLIGTLNNTGATLPLGPATESWTLTGGTISGGTVTETGGADLIGSGAGGQLIGVTIDGNLDLTQGITEPVVIDIENGLTLNGTAYIGDAIGTTQAYMYFENTETLSGTGTLLFGPHGNNLDPYNLIEVTSSSTTLTIAQGITIRGCSGDIEGDFDSDTTDTIVNDGTISADNSGGAVGSFVDDTDYSGGSTETETTVSPIDTSGVTNPAPQGVYQTQRNGSSFSYTLPILTPGAPYTVRLDFAEIQFNAPKLRTFNVAINGTQVLTDFDVFATAGAENKAVAETFTATANASGQIVINFTGVGAFAVINGIELSSGNTQVLAINCGDLFVSGGLTIEPDATFTNQGAIEASNGAEVNIVGPVTVNDPGYLAAGSSDRMFVRGNLLGDTHNSSSYQVAGAMYLDGVGSASSPQLFEVMSNDLGADESGFTNNFDYGALTIEGQAYVELVDQSHNSGGSGSEALYVDSLVVQNAATLNLNGFHVYTKSAQISPSATILGGTIDQLPTVVATDAGGTYNGNPYPATATATDANGNGVSGSYSFTYYVGTSATGTGSSTAPTNAGTYTVVASFTSGNPSYSNAQNAPLTFMINAAVPTVIASDPSGLFTGNPFTATVTATGVGGATVNGNPTVTYYVGSTVSGNGSATAPTTVGTYTVVAAFTSTDTNYVAGPTDSQPVTFVIAQAPAITSPNKVSFAVGVNSSFTLTATGYPAPSFAITAGALPSGVTLTPAGILSGTPSAGTAKSYPLTITANNGFGQAATQTFTLTVTAAGSAPKITSAKSATFTAGIAGSFQVKFAGSPTPVLGETGSLPGGLTFNAATGVLSGTPAAGTGGKSTLTFTASNGVGTAASQTFTLTVDQAAAITSANAATFVAGKSGKFTVTATGYPKPTWSEAGTLPSGVTFNTSTGVLSGTPAAGTGGTYSLTFTATNGVGTAASQTFTLTVKQVPAITSANTANFVVGQSGSFTVTATGFPASTFIESGTLPKGLKFNKTTGVLSGTPAAGTANNYALTFTATNSAGKSTAQAFTLVISNAAPAVAPLALGTTLVTTAVPAATNEVPSTTLVSSQPQPMRIHANDTNAAAQTGDDHLNLSSGDGTNQTSSSNSLVLVNHVYPHMSLVYRTENPTSDDIATDLDNAAVQWAGLSAAIEVLGA